MKANDTRAKGMVFNQKAGEYIQELEAELAALKAISLDSKLSWQDKHIASFKVLNPELLQEKGE